MMMMMTTLRGGPTVTAVLTPLLHHPHLSITHRHNSLTIINQIVSAFLFVFRVDAGKVELDGASYAGLALPFNITQLIWIEVILVGGAEIYRNTETDPERRCYPGGIFDPLNLASEDPERAFNLKTAEIKHARLAMVSFFGEFAVSSVTAAYASKPQRY